jgi:CRISPR-associated protein Csm3
MSEQDFRFKGNLLISGKIHCKTGLHIGSSKAELEIGGLDNPIILDPLTKAPVIPGSSLKGKIRSLLELQEQKYTSSGKPHGHEKDCSDADCWLCTIFGSSDDVERGPTRLIVRDAIHQGRIETEVKAENVINRVTGKAESPRFFERVPAGTIFDFEMVYQIYNTADLEHLAHLFEGMHLLEDSYLGGSGSRGYGKIQFKDITLTVKTVEDYKKGNDGYTINTIASVQQLLTDTDALKKIRQVLDEGGNS